MAQTLADSAADVLVQVVNQIVQIPAIDEVAIGGASSIEATDLSAPEVIIFTSAPTPAPQEQTPQPTPVPTLEPPTATPASTSGPPTMDNPVEDEIDQDGAQRFAHCIVAISVSVLALLFTR